MPKKDRPDAHSNNGDVSVQLKPILGIRPGVYLTAAYGLGFLLLVFFLLFYPGLRNRGSYFSLTTFPSHATVTIDGVYAGSTPCVLFLWHGSRTVDISKPFYSHLVLHENVRGRVFGTLIVPDKRRDTRRLAVADVDGLLKWALADYQKNPGIPETISESVMGVDGSESTHRLYDFIDNSMLFVTGESQLRQVLLGAGRVAARSLVLTPISLIGLVQHFVQLKQKYDNFPAWLLLVLSRPNGNRLAASPWIQQYLATYRNVISKYYQEAALSPSSGSGARISIQGIDFRAIPPGQLVLGKDDNLESLGKTIDLLLAHPVSIGAFYMGSTEITNSQYQSFVLENPDWAPRNRDALVKEGLVNDGYLSDWPAGAYQTAQEGFPVTSVSWHAAVAFSEWLTRKVQPSLPGYVAHLPSEAEWEWAARGGLRGMPYPLGGKPGTSVFFQKGATGPSRAGSSEPNGYGLRDMLGNVWEWCGDPFTLTTNLLSSLDPRVNLTITQALPVGPDRAVRGGAWENPAGAVKVYTRGSQPAEWCTPYLGFRVALSRR
jgi:iron(II)-dependent oxidoreductase